MRRSSLTLLVVALAVPAASAQPTPPDGRRADRLVEVSLLGPVAAVAAGAVIGTSEAVGGTVAVAGLLAGPSYGHVRLGDARRTLIGTGLRTAGFLLIAQLFQSDNVLGATDDTLVFGGLVLFVGGTAYSVATIHKSARERTGTTTVSVVPAGRGAVVAARVHL